MHNSDFWTGITSFYASKTSPVVLCIQYSVIRTTNTCLYGSQPLSFDFVCKTASFGAELQVSMGPRPHLSLCACKTAWLASELLVSMGHSPHLWLLQAKQRLLDHNYKCLWKPDLTCRFLHVNSMISTRNTRLYGFQPWSVVLCIQNSDVKTKLHVSMCPRHHLWSSACKTARIAPE